ncbi:LacI family DNA-binding transcriptional regulator [Lederbergia galactosidilytica]|uniref:Transcriptional regulator n=1 Tax=Lederbergia galactosidilytica TaxID=217031 RepID=A0A178A5W2_9BACI|nr:LacI family DNA-binding transcriptional regulator [Lederbergia galactosidilytica]OAK75491.1 transcriptional regulator [Lederbergia galactosidilytica]
MKLTISDIAKMANVSPGTVSKVMNQTGSLSSQTIEKVKRVIEETGYEPSFSAKSLATKKSNLIGLIYVGDIQAQINHPFFNEVVNAFKNMIGQLGYDILMFSKSQAGKQNHDYLDRCNYYQLDGCLIIAGDKIEEATYKLDKSHIPCVGIDIELIGPASSYVMTDNRKISARVVDYFHSSGVKDIAFIGGAVDSNISNIRKEAFIHYMNRFGLNINPNWIKHGDYFKESGYKAMKEILAEGSRPQAVYTVSDMMALGVLKALKEADISVPEDIMVIGCDDIEVCRYSEPKLATVKQDKEKIGELAAQMLHKLINGEKEVISMLVEPELVIRESAIIRQ